MTAQITSTSTTTTLKNNGNTYMSVDTNDVVTMNVASLNGGQLGGNRNKIIGGDFTTNPWQRGTSFAAIADNAYFADRWFNALTTTAAITASKVADAPTAAEAGTFTQHCISLAVTTADTSIAAGDIAITRQHIEGLNAASFGFGQAGSRNVTLSFWVKGTKTGIHCFSLGNSAQNRSYVAEYTINDTNTWEYKTITIPVDTSGTWLYDTGIGVRINFASMSGSTYHTTANTWTAGVFFATSNQVNALDSTSNTFKIALVQIELGTVATPFEHRSFGEELALCQRYYQVVRCSNRDNGASANTKAYSTSTPFKTSMRVAPTATFSAITSTGVGSRNLTSITSEGAAYGTVANASGNMYDIADVLLTSEL